MSSVAAVDPTHCWEVGVVVPARDEVDRIGAAVTSIRRSLDAAPGVTGCIVVVADRCSDATAAVARHALGDDGVVIDIAAACVGAARAVGTDAALGLLGSRLRRIWLLTTDADSTVPPDWIGSHLALATTGAAAVAGVVRVDDLSDHQPVVADRFARRYLSYPDGSHPHVHGANLGVRADVYRSVGGWSELRTGEDHDLWRRIRAGGWPAVSSIDTWVTTSGRRHGRAPAGFAGYLAELAAPRPPGRSPTNRPGNLVDAEGVS